MSLSTINSVICISTTIGFLFHIVAILYMTFFLCIFALCKLVARKYASLTIIYTILLVLYNCAAIYVANN